MSEQVRTFVPSDPAKSPRRTRLTSTLTVFRGDARTLLMSLTKTLPVLQALIHVYRSGQHYQITCT
jgi:hypothetical protein